MTRPKIERFEIVCKECGRVFYERASKRRKFCSKVCGAKFTNRLRILPLKKYVCELCGVDFEVRSCRKGVKYCSYHCSQTAKAISASPQRADKIRGTGKKTPYIKFKGRHIHRILAEQKLGRALKKGEIVHHADLNSRNDMPDNLDVITQSKHINKHRAALLAGRKCFK